MIGWSCKKLTLWNSAYTELSCPAYTNDQSCYGNQPNISLVFAQTQKLNWETSLFHPSISNEFFEEKGEKATCDEKIEYEQP